MTYAGGSRRVERARMAIAWCIFINLSLPYSLLQSMYANLEARSGQVADKKAKNADDEAPPGLAPGEYFSYVYDHFALDFIKKRSK